MPSAVSTKRTSIDELSDVLSDSDGEPTRRNAKRARLERRNGRVNGVANHDNEDGEEDDEGEEEEEEVNGQNGDEQSEMGSLNYLPAADLEIEEEELLGREGIDITENTHEFQPGSIKWIYCENFVTYSKIVANPTPSLNMVIGPNGTGKSTLVCAMCLGLGWDPKVLGRAKNVSEFVKHGSTEAIIQIKLQGQPNETDPVIKRKIKKESNRSDWWINDKPSTEKKVKAFAKGFNIQVDNLCQFLPQDRVSDFAHMPEIDKFKETLRAAAPPNVTEDHIALQKIGKELAEMSSIQETDQQQLASLLEKQKVAEADVAKFKERQKVQSDIDLYNKAKPWLEYKIQRAQTRQLREDSKAADRAVKELKQQSEVELEKPKAKKKYADAVSAATKQRKAQFKKKEEQVAKHRTDKIEPFDAAITKAKADEAATERRDNKRRDDMQALKRKIRAAKTSLGNEPPPVDYQALNAQIAQKKQEIMEHKERGKEIGEQIEPIRNKGGQLTNEITRENVRLENIKSGAGQREKALANTSPDTLKVWEWYQANKHHFEKEIFPPPMICCFVPDERMSDIVESTMPERTTLLCQSRKDYLELVAHVFGSKDRDIQGMNLPDVTIREYSQHECPELRHQPPGRWSKEQLQQLGFAGYMLDFVQAPDPVKNMLCNEAMYHNWPVATHDDPNASERIQAAGIRRWSTSQSTYNLVARYGVSSTTVSQVRPAKFLRTQGVDQGAKHECEKRIAELTWQLDETKKELQVKREEYDTLKMKLSPIQDDLKAIEANKRKQTEAITAYARAKEAIPRYEEDLQRKINAGTEHKAKMQEFAQVVAQATTDRARAATRHAVLVSELVAVHMDWVRLQLRELEATSDLKVIETQNEALLREIAAAEARAQQLKTRYLESKRIAERNFKHVTNMMADFNDEEKAALNADTFPQTLSELDEELERLSMALSLLSEGNPRALQQFEERRVRIDALQRKVSAANERLDTTRAAMTQLRTSWEPKVDALMANISRAFTRSFARINCAGEVRIDKHPDDFARWAVNIWVKFRESERLQLLTGQRQSGGERAVATVFYLMALQSQAKSPFRVVDEINQGMDPRNERMVHHRLVNIACQLHTSQYFLITPKLLVDLLYHPRMKLHCIYSGDMMQEDVVIDYKKAFKVARKLKAAGMLPLANGGGSGGATVNGDADSVSDDDADNGVVDDSE